MKKNLTAVAQAQNSAKLSADGKTVRVEVYNIILGHDVTCFLPANEETKALPYHISQDVADAMKAKYGSVTDSKRAKKQTAKEHEVMKAKMTREQFAKKWNGVEVIPTLDEIKNATARAGESDLDVGFIKKFDNGNVLYNFRKDGMYLAVRPEISCGGKVTQIGRFNQYFLYGLKNKTKVSFNYDALDQLFESVVSVTDNIELPKEKEITVRLVRNRKSGYDMIVPQDIKVNEIRYEQMQV